MKLDLFLHKILILKFLRKDEKLRYEEIGYILNVFPSVAQLYDQKLELEHIEQLISKSR